MNDLNAGRLVVEVVGDTTGLARDLQAKIDVATRDVKARIRTEVDERKVAVQAQSAAKAAEAGAKIKAKVEIDKTQAAALRLELASITGGEHKVRVSLIVDEAKAQILALDAQLSGADRAIRVKAITDEARAQIATLRAQEEAKAIDLKVKASGGGAGGGALSSLGGDPEEFGAKLSQFAMIPAIVSGVALLAGSLVDVAGGLISIASAGAPALETLAAIPNFAGIAVSALGTLFAALMGPLSVLKQLSAADAASAASAGSSASSRKAAADQIKMAQQSLANAERAQAQDRVASARRVAQAQTGIAQSIVAANQQVIAAEQNLARAQDAERSTQEALTQARVDARNRLVDYANSAKDAALSTEAAGLAYQRAVEHANQVNTSPTSTALDRSEADLGVRQASQRILDAKQAQKEAEQSNNKEQAGGVQGDPQVVAATKAAAAAQQSAKDAVTAIETARKSGEASVAAARAALAQAEQTASNQAISDSQRIAAAQRSLTQAISAQSGATGGAAKSVNAAKAAFDKLTPAGQAFVTFLRKTFLPAVKGLGGDAQTALLPFLQDGLGRMLGLLPEVRRSISLTGASLGAAFSNLGKATQSPLFRGGLDKIIGSNDKALRSLLGAAVGLVQPLVNIGVAVGPLVERFSKWLNVLVTGKLTNATSNVGKLTAMFTHAGDIAAELGKILGNTFGALNAIFKSSQPAGQGLLDSLVVATGKFRDWAKDPEIQAKLTDFFTRAGAITKTVGGLFVKVIEFLGNLGNAVAGGPLDKILGKIGGIVDFLSRLLKLPGAGGGITAILGISLAAVGLGKAAGSISKIHDTMKAMGNLPVIGKLIGSLPGMGGDGNRETTGRHERRSHDDGYDGGGDEEGSGKHKRKHRIGKGLALAGLGLAGVAIGALMDPKGFNTLINAIPGIITRFVAAFPILIASLVKAIPLVLNAIIDALPVVIAALASAIPRVIAALAGALPLIVNALVTAIPLIVTALTTSLPIVIDALVQLIPALVNGLATALPKVIDALVTLLPKIIDAIVKALPLILNALVAALPKIIDAYVKALPIIIAAIVNALPKIINALVTALPLIITALVNALPKVIGAIVTALPKIINALVRAVPQIITALVAALPKVIDALVKAIPRIITVLVTAIPQIITALVGAVPQVITALVKAAPQVIGAIVGGVPKIITGIFNGLRSIDWGSLIKGVGSALNPLHWFGHANGGIVPGYEPGTDRYPAMLSAGEGILRPEVVRALRPNTIHLLNSLARSGGVEAVLRRAGSALRHVAGSGAPGSPMAPGGGGTVIHDGAIRLTVMNPVPETASQTVNSRLRVLAYQGLFDGGN